MSQLHQMQLTYVPVEDRVMFRMNTKTRQEFRFWMTRRYVQVLWNTVLKLLKERNDQQLKPTETEAAKPLPEQIKEAALAAEHQKVVEKSDFQTQYQESSYLPLGESPVLLFSVGVKPGANGQAILVMSPQEGQGIEIGLNDQIVHSLCKLLAETAQKANWELHLDFNQASEYLPDQQGLN
ncbi:MAG: hypothetical protein HKN23_12200 [Verrucomicrobiales bacterium]|nr:hypothetical protein [Verrucomicrobiales bacterium]